MVNETAKHSVGVGINAVSNAVLAALLGGPSGVAPGGAPPAIATTVQPFPTVGREHRVRSWMPLSCSALVTMSVVRCFETVPSALRASALCTAVCSPGAYNQPTPHRAQLPP